MEEEDEGDDEEGVDAESLAALAAAPLLFFSSQIFFKPGKAYVGAGAGEAPGVAVVFILTWCERTNLEESSVAKSICLV